eukprot:1843480-Amphidinium_carterae.1
MLPQRGIVYCCGTQATLLDDDDDDDGGGGGDDDDGGGDDDDGGDVDDDDDVDDGGGDDDDDVRLMGHWLEDLGAAPDHHSDVGKHADHGRVVHLGNVLCVLAQLVPCLRAYGVSLTTDSQGDQNQGGAASTIRLLDIG